MTYADLHVLASDFVNEDECSRDQRAPDALKFRLFLSKFLARVKQWEDKGMRAAITDNSAQPDSVQPPCSHSRIILGPPRRCALCGVRLS